MTDTAPILEPSFEERQQAGLDALITTVAETRTAIASLQALEATALNAALELALERAKGGSASRRSADLEVRTVAAEFAAALRVSDRTVQAQLSDASTLVGRFPATHAALAAGRITRAHARAIVDAGANLDDDLRGTYEHAALAVAQTESPGRLRPQARMIAARLDEQTLTERHTRARDDRSVVLRPLEDGMSQIILTAPAVIAQGIDDRTTQLARATADADPDGTDSRTMQQRRADVLCDLLLAGAPAAVEAVTEAAATITAHVQVVIPALALAGATDTPADLAGYGPIDADTARHLALLTPGWDRVFVHPATGQPCAVDRYRPGADLLRLLRARDPHCRFPGCRMPVRRCDVDHTINAQHGGPTCFVNLAHLCRRHHTLKHATQWAVRQLPGGILEWTSPGGRIYTDGAPPPVAFAATPLPSRADPLPSRGAPPGEPPPF